MLRLIVKDKAIKDELENLEARQIPFVMALGLNLLANEAQAAERQGMRDRFDLRRVDFNLRGIKIEKANRATKTSWRVIIQVDTAVSYLDRFEEEGIHEPFGGRHFLWVPNDAVFRNRIIQARNPLHPKNLHMHQEGHRIIGDQRTFMIQTERGPMVLQRLGKGQGISFTAGSLSKLTLETLGRKRGGKLVKDRSAGTQVLYVLRQRVSVPLKLEFFPTTTAVVEERAAPIFREVVSRAMATARG
jgi:hypothetical protein